MPDLFHPSPIITAINLLKAFHLKSLTESIHFDSIFIDYHSSNVSAPVIPIPPNLKARLFLVQSFIYIHIYDFHVYLSYWWRLVYMCFLCLRWIKPCRPRWNVQPAMHYWASVWRCWRLRKMNRNVRHVGPAAVNLNGVECQMNELSRWEAGTKMLWNL